MNLGKPLFFSFAVLTVVLFHSFSWGFSLGQIEVKTSFNKSFSAEIPVVLDGPMELVAEVGNLKDYERLGVFRNPLLDQVSVKIQRESEKAATLHLTSGKPLFIPSFNLVIKCVHNGGTIYENYLVAADFRKQLSLNVPREKRESVEQKMSSGEGKPLEEVQQQREEEALPPPQPKIKPKELKREIIVQEFERKKRERVQPEKKKSVPEKEDLTEKASEKKPERKTPEKKKEYYRVLSGDTLYKIARKIGASKARVESYVVEIWKKNLDKFFNNNMNLLDQGVSLDITDVSKNTLTRRESLAVIRSQWKEIRKEKKTRRGALHVAGTPEMEIPLPYEKSFWNVEKIAQAVREWEKRWENRDLDLFMELYSKRFRKGVYRYKSWRSFKGAFNARHGQFEVTVHNIKIRIEKGLAVASFTQDFSSARMQTTGTKSLSFVNETDGYKIVHEVWEKEVQKEGKRPYVVHVSSFRSRELALKEVNWLRKKGLSAYEIHSDIGKRGRFYRVVVDRFATEAEATRFSRRATKKKFVDYGNPLKMPFAIEAGLFTDKDLALKRILELRKKLFSPYPLVKCGMEECYFQILIGAYAKAENAMPVSERLTGAGFANTVIMP
ncbi:MAG: SPOR domain-containing protein [Nitrospinota bacterium]